MVEDIDHVLVDGAQNGAPLHQGSAQVTRPLHVGQQQGRVPWGQQKQWLEHMTISRRVNISMLDVTVLVVLQLGIAMRTLKTGSVKIIIKLLGPV